MEPINRIRGDVALALTEKGLLARHGDEETLVIEAALSPEDALPELASRGLVVADSPDSDWQRIFAGRRIEAKIAFGGGPREFADALNAHEMMSAEGDAAVQLFVETGVDIEKREAFDRSMRERGTTWLWVQIPTLFEIRMCSFVPGETACAKCLERRLLNNRRNPGEYLAVLAQNGAKLPAVRMPAVWQAASGLAVLEAARLAAGTPAQSVGRLLSLDLSRFKTESERLLPVPGCEVCGE